MPLDAALVAETRSWLVKAEKAGRRSEFEGKSYYFCADECKEQFDKSPERYVKK